MAAGTGKLPGIAILSFALAILAQWLRFAPIGWVFAAAVYFIVWWVVLFAVLPFGIRTQHDDGAVVQGTSAGAPSEHRMGRVACWTTIVASTVFIVILLALGARLIPLDFAS